MEGKMISSIVQKFLAVPRALGGVILYLLLGFIVSRVYGMGKRGFRKLRCKRKRKKHHSPLPNYISDIYVDIEKVSDAECDLEERADTKTTKDTKDPLGRRMIRGPLKVWRKFKRTVAENVSIEATFDGRDPTSYDLGQTPVAVGEAVEAFVDNTSPSFDTERRELESKEEYFTNMENFRSLYRAFQTYDISYMNYRKKVDVSNVEVEDLELPDDIFYQLLLRKYDEKVDIPDARLYVLGNLLQGIVLSDLKPEVKKAARLKKKEFKERSRDLKLEIVQGAVDTYETVKNKIKEYAGFSTYYAVRTLIPTSIIAFQAASTGNDVSLVLAVVLLIQRYTRASHDNITYTAAICSYLVIKTFHWRRSKKVSKDLEERGFSFLEGLPNSWMTCLVGVLLTLCCGLILYRLPTRKDFDAVFNRFGNLPKNVKGSFEVFTTSTKLVSEFQDWFSMKYLGKKPENPSLLYGKAIKEMFKPEFLNRLKWDRRAVTEATENYDSFIEWYECLGTKEKNANRHLYRRYDQLSKELSHSISSGVTTRCEPVTICLYGQPGMGKTSSLDALNVYVLKQRGYLNDIDIREGKFAEYVYYLKAGTKHWQGYNTKTSHIVVMDDANQLLPELMEGVPNAVNVMWYAHSAPASVPQASIENKEANSAFNSELIILTDNIMTPNLAKVCVEPEAYKRRIDFTFEVVVKPGVETVMRQGSNGPYAVPKFDKDSLNIDKLMYRVLDHSGRVERTLDFLQMASLVVSKIEEKQEFYLRKQKLLATFGKAITTSIEDEERVLSFEQLGKVAQLKVAAEVHPTPPEQGIDDILVDELQEKGDVLGEIVRRAIIQKYVRSPVRGVFNLFMWPFRVTYYKVRKERVGKKSENWFEKVVEDMARAKRLESLSRLVSAILLLILTLFFFFKSRRTVEERSHQEKTRTFTTMKKNIQQRIQRGQVELRSDDSITISSHMEYEPFKEMGKVEKVQEMIPASGLRTIFKEFSHFSNDQNLREEIENKVFKNLYHIERIRMCGDVPYVVNKMNILFVRGVLAVTARHFFRGSETTDYIRISKMVGDNWVVREFRMEELELFPIKIGKINKDACFVRFPRSVKPHRDISKMFLKKSETTDLVNERFGCVSYICSKDRVNLLASFVDGAVKVSNVVIGNHTGIDTALLVSLDTKKGSCGAPVYSVYPNGPRRLFGIVSGGSENMTAATVICQEEVQVVLDLVEPQDKLCYSDFSETILSDVVEKESVVPEELKAPGFTPVARLAPPIYSPTNTKIRPSPVHGRITTPITAPVYLTHPEMNIDKLNISKYAKIPQNIPQNIQTRFRLSIRKRLAGMKWLKATLFEAAQGRGNQSPMNRKTSPGFPWGFISDTPGKKSYLGENEEWFISPEIAGEVERLEQKIKTNQEMDIVLWTDQKKDERLPISKVEKGKCRYFAIGPLHFNLLCRQYLMSVSEHLVENKIANGSLVSCDPEKEFTDVWRLFAKDIDMGVASFIDGDYSNFDASLSRTLILIVAEEIARCVPQEDKIVIHAIFLTLCSSLHVHKSIIYELEQSQPSGNIFTTFLNTLYNLGLIEAVFETVLVGHGIEPRFTAIAYGDDNIIGFHAEIVHLITPQVFSDIEKMMSDTGHIYTNGSKDSSGFVLKTIEEVKILKRSFVLDEDKNIVYAPLDIDVVLERLNWDQEKNPDLKKEQVRVNVDTILRDLIHHDEYMWDSFLPELREVAKEFHCDSQYLNMDHAEARDKFYFDLYDQGVLLEEYGDNEQIWFDESNVGDFVKIANINDEKVPFATELLHQLFSDERIDGYYHLAFLDSAEHTLFLSDTNKKKLSETEIEFILKNFYKYLIKVNYEEDGNYTIYTSCVGIFGISPGKYYFEERRKNRHPKFLYSHPMKIMRKVGKLEERSDVNELVRDVQQILTIDDVQVPEELEVPAQVDMPDDLLVASHESKEYSYREIVTRAHTVASFMVGSGAAPGSLLVDLSFPNVLLANPQVGELVSNFKMFRANVKVRTIVTAAPTAAFALRQIIVGDVNPQFLNNRSQTLLQQSQFDNTLLVGPSLVRCEQILPWVSPFSGRDTTTLDGNNGSVRLYIVVTPSEQIQVQIIANFEDDPAFDLSFPYGGPRLLISRKMDRVAALAVKKASEYQGQRAITRVFDMTTMALYMDEERSMLTKGLALGSKALGVASKIGSVSAMKNVASTAITSAARSFLGSLGFSKPNNLEAVEIRKLMVAPDHVNAHGVHVSQTFGVDRANMLLNEPGRFGSSMDDMDFHRFYSHPNYIKGFEVDNTQPSGTLVASIPIWPFNGATNGTYNTQGVSYGILSRTGGGTEISFVVLGGTVLRTRNVGQTGTILIPVLRDIWFSAGTAPGTLLAEAGENLAWDYSLIGGASQFSGSGGSFSLAVPAVGGENKEPLWVDGPEIPTRTCTFQEYIANMFEYWIASMRFDFQCVATSFHSVKLRFVVMPGVYSTTSISWENIGAFESDIVEFGANSKHQVLTPHMTNFNFKKNPNAAYSRSPDMSNCIGTLAVYVQEMLQVTSAVAAPRIHFFVEQSCIDMKVGMPNDLPVVPIIGPLSNDLSTYLIKEMKDKAIAEKEKKTYVAPVMSKSTGKEKEAIKWQPGHREKIAIPVDMEHKVLEEYGDLGAVRAEGALDNKVRFNSPAANQKTHPEGISSRMVISTMGEDISHMKQFMGQFQEPITVQSSFITSGWKTYILNVTKTVQFGTAFPEQVTRLDYVACPFSFFQGSFQVRIYKKNTINEPLVFCRITTQRMHSPQQRLIVQEEPGFSSDSNMGGQTTTALVGRCIPVVFSLEGVASVHIPAFNPCSVLRNTPMNVNTIALAEPQDRWLAVTVRHDQELAFSISFGDDRIYGRPVGLPVFGILPRDSVSSPCF